MRAISGQRGRPVCQLLRQLEWGDEWGRAVRVGTRKRGTKDGRTAFPGEVILGADAMALAEEQVVREEVGPAS